MRQIDSQALLLLGKAIMHSTWVVIFCGVILGLFFQFTLKQYEFNLYSTLFLMKVVLICILLKSLISSLISLLTNLSRQNSLQAALMARRASLITHSGLVGLFS